jgi:hypothetical protein
LPSISGKTIGTSDALYLLLFVSAGTDFNARTGSLGIQSNTFEFWGVQVEYGSKATPFQTATGTIQGELAAAQRYYEAISYASGSMITTGQAQSTSAAYAPLSWKVTKRATPTISTVANTVMPLIAGGTNANGTIAYSTITADSARLDVTGATGLVAGNAVSFQAQSGTVTIAISSEL